MVTRLHKRWAISEIYNTLLYILRYNGKAVIVCLLSNCRKSSGNRGMSKSLPMNFFVNAKGQHARTAGNNEETLDRSEPRSTASHNELPNYRTWRHARGVNWMIVARYHDTSSKKKNTFLIKGCLELSCREKRIHAKTSLATDRLHITPQLGSLTFLGVIRCYATLGSLCLNTSQYF